MAIDQFRHFDTRRADGAYITFVREICDDEHADPRDYLFQDADYRKEDQARLDAWKRGDWHMIGIRVRADIDIVRAGHGVTHTLVSPGLWGVESDSGESYFAEIAMDEIMGLIDDFKTLNAAPVSYQCR